MINLSSFTTWDYFKRVNQELGCELDKWMGSMPAHIYVQNRDGLYLWCNKNQARTLNFRSSFEFANKIVFDIVDEHNAEIVFKNDQEVIKERTEKNFKEKAFFISGVEMASMSSKKPILDPDGDVIGMFGVSIAIPKIVLDTKSTISRISDISGLTLREAECAYHYSQGKNVKQIGRILSISYRTVEKHLENIRIKLDLSRRCELFAYLNALLSNA